MGLKFICDGGAWQESPESVRLELADGTITHLPGQTITATALNGIKAQGDGAAWSGVTNYPVTT